MVGSLLFGGPTRRGVALVSKSFVCIPLGYFIILCMGCEGADWGRQKPLGRKGSQGDRLGGDADREMEAWKSSWEVRDAKGGREVSLLGRRERPAVTRCSAALSFLHMQ